MADLRRIGRAIAAGGAALFVVVFLAAMAIQNVVHFLRVPLPGHEAAARLLATLGADQYWTMFGAHFPSQVRVPVVQIVLAGGKRVFLPPAVAPAVSEDALRAVGREVPEAAREAPWRANFGTGRIEKLESRAASPGPGWLGVRTAYAAFRVREWARDAPDLAARVRFVDLLSVVVSGAAGGRAPYVVAVEPVPIEPRLLGDWPAPRARQLFEARS